MTTLSLNPLVAGSVSLTANPVVDTSRPWFDPRDFGARGDGSTDDTAAIQAAIDTARASNGTVWLPRSTHSYVVSSTLVLNSGAAASVNLVGEGGTAAVIEWAGSSNSSVFQADLWRYSHVQGVNVLVPSGKSGVVAWNLDSSGSTSHLTFKDCLCDFGNSGDSCVGWRMGHTVSGAGGLDELCWISCSVSGNPSNSNTIGWVNESANGLQYVWLNSGGSFLGKMFTNVSTAGATQATGGNAMWFYGMGASNNAIDFEFGTAGNYGIWGGRFEVGTKFLNVRNGSASMSITVDSAHMSDYGNTATVFLLDTRPIVLQLNNLQVNHSTNDHTAAFITMGGTDRMKVVVKGGSIRAADPCYTINGSASCGIEFDNTLRTNDSFGTPVGFFGQRIKTLTYSASITPDVGQANDFKIAATDGVAFAINAPTFGTTGQVITFDILNSSGGVMGAITWNAAFLLAGAFTNPASTKRRTISFYYDGTNWVEINRAAADI